LPRRRRPENRATLVDVVRSVTATRWEGAAAKTRIGRNTRRVTKYAARGEPRPVVGTAECGSPPIWVGDNYRLRSTGYAANNKTPRCAP
jgi:hypothetical protein